MVPAVFQITAGQGDTRDVDRNRGGFGTLKTYKSFPHGMPTTQAETVNADLLAFIKA